MKVKDETYKEVDLYKKQSIVFGEGPVPARVMFVGEAPGAEEQARGRPFVGDAGTLLNTALREVGLSRQDAYVTNTVKHRPPKNRDPYIKEVRAYMPILQEELDTVQPDLVVLLGGVAAMPFFGKKSVVDRRGFIMREGTNLGDWTTISTYHPAAFLHGNPLWPVFLADLRKAKAYLDGEYQESPTEVFVADNLKDAYDVLDKMAAADIFSFDLETTGFSFKSDKILCWSFSDEEGKAYVIPLQDVDKPIFEGEKLRALNSQLQEFLFTPNNPFVGWNHQFDLNFLYELWGFENRDKLLDNWFADSMLFHHLLEEEMPHTLEYVASLHTSMPAWDRELKAYKKKHKIKSYRDIPGEILWPYAGKDADATLRLFYQFLPRLEEEDLGDFYFDHQHLMAKVFSRMAYRGVPVDLEYLQGLRDSVSIKLENIMARIFEAVGEEFNPRSHHQKAVILYDKLGLPEVTPRTDAGNRVTDKDTMELLADKHPVPKMFVEHSILNKQMTSYLGDSDKTIFSNIEEDGFCRTNWLLHGTETGRCSSANPNLTNIPRSGGFREAFKAPEGWKMIEADYAQAELRYAAYRAGEQEVIDLLNAGYDAHQASAAAIFNVPIDEVTPEQRSIGKCFSLDTEVLTRDGWRMICEIDTKTEIVTCSFNTQKEPILEWDFPTEVFTQKNHTGELIHFSGEGMDLRVTPDHRMIRQAWNARKKEWGGLKVELAGELYYHGRFFNAGDLVGESWTPSEILLRLAVATQADGTIEKGRIRFGFTKRRKIERLKRLLDESQLKYYHSVTKYMDRFDISVVDSPQILVLLDGKKLPWNWLGLSERARSWVLEEAEYWDSCRMENWNAYCYSSVIEQNLDVLQALASVTARKATKRGDFISVKQHGYTWLTRKNVAYYEHWGEVACLSVPSTFVLVRSGGKPVITGQTVNFLIQYGGGPGQLAKSAGVSYQKATLLIKKFFQKRPALQQHMREVGRMALDPDIRRLTNVYGRVRHMPVGFTKKARKHIIKEAVNYDPQSGVADTLWRSMYLLDKWFEENKMRSYFVIALHDGLHILSPDEEVDAVVEKVQEIMTLPLPVIGASLPVDIKILDRWESKG